MQVGHRLEPLAAAQVGMDRVTLDRTGADDRHLHDQVVEAARLRLPQRLLLGAQLDLEEPDGVDLADHVVDALVVEGQRVEVGPLPRGLLDEVEALRDRRERAQPEQIHLDEPDVLDVVLVELHDHPSRHGRPLHRHDVDERLAGDEHAADMDAQMARRALDPTEDVDELLPRVVRHRACR